MPTASSPVPRSASTQPMPPQYGPAGRRLQGVDDPQGARLGRAGDRAGREGRRQQLRPAGVRGAARPARSRRGGPAPGASRRRTGRGRSTEPVAQTRPRSLRTRSTIITFSAWSFSRRSASVRPVPLIGPGLDGPADAARGRARGTRWRSRRRARAAGSFRRTVPGCRAPAGRSVRPRRRAGSRQRRGQHPAEVGLVDLAGRDVLADPAHARRVRGAVERGRPVAGGRARATAPGTGRGHRLPPVRRAKRAQVRRPSKSATTAQKPEESRAAGSLVTSRRPVATRPPKRARGARSDTLPSLWRVSCGCPDRVFERAQRSTLRKRVFVLARESARVQHVAGTRRADRKRHADVAQLVERNLAKVEVASSNLVVRSQEVGDLPEPPHSWWSGREARQRPAKPSTRVQIPSPPPRTISSAGERFPDTEEVTGSIPVSSTGPQGPRSARIPARLAQRESASLTRKRSLVQSQYRARSTHALGSCPRD